MPSGRRGIIDCCPRRIRIAPVAVLLTNSTVPAVNGGQPRTHADTRRICHDPHWSRSVGLSTSRAPTQGYSCSPESRLNLDIGVPLTAVDRRHSSPVWKITKRQAFKARQTSHTSYGGGWRRRSHWLTRRLTTMHRFPRVLPSFIGLTQPQCTCASAIPQRNEATRDRVNA